MKEKIIPLKYKGVHEMTDKYKEVMDQLVAGRTLDQQIKYIKKYAGHGVHPMLRSMVLHMSGIPEPKPTAENAIIFGCYIPFVYGGILSAFIKVLDILCVDYTYLENEYCCGSPMMDTYTGTEKAKAIRASRNFMRLNTDMARQKGANSIFYFCLTCFRMVSGVFPKRTEHRYCLDLVMDKLEKQNLRMPTPTVMGYFEGCHRYPGSIFPEADINWARYRQLLDRVDNLKIIDLPSKFCCAIAPERIIETAQKYELDTIVSPCNGCYYGLAIASGNRIKSKHYIEVILQSLQGEQVQGGQSYWKP
jgi:Fe-S oxidoreductase